MYWNDKVAGAIAGTGEYKALIALQPIAPLWDLNNPSFYEVLIRLQDEEGKIYPAGAFIEAIARDEKLMLALDRWIVDQVAVLIERTNYTYAINVSAFSIKTAYYPQAIANTLRNAGAAARRLALEINEKDAIGYSERKAFEKLGQNHQVWLDDFGAIEDQASSFGYFLYDWISGVKVDMVFAEHILNPQRIGINARACVKALVQMCCNQGRSIVIEGVETQEQIEYLRKYSPVGAQLYLQGWAIGMPRIE